MTSLPKRWWQRVIKIDNYTAYNFKRTCYVFVSKKSLLQSSCSCFTCHVLLWRNLVYLHLVRNHFSYVLHSVYLSIRGPAYEHIHIAYVFFYVVGFYRQILSTLE